MSDDFNTFSPIGQETKRRIVGEKLFTSAAEAETPFDREWQVYSNNQLWARTWARGILSHQQLSLMTLSILAARGCMGEFEAQFRNALERTHVPPKQLREALIHIGLYCGMPIGRQCFTVASRVLKESGRDLDELMEP